MRPVLKNPGNPGYPLPATFSFTGSDARSISQVLRPASANSVPVLSCLLAWQRYVVGDKSLPGTNLEKSQAIAAIQRRVTNAYKRAAVPLTEELGAFCSFCETPLPGLLEVEHCAPKSEYPSFALSWDNFLLACSPCNTGKSNVPSRSAVRAWSAVPLNSENDYYNLIRFQHYVWADIGGGSHSWLPVYLESYAPATGAWSVLPMDRAAHLDNSVVSHDMSKREVQARIFDPVTNSHIPMIVRSQIVPAGENAARGNEMVKLCHLNDNGSFTSTYDRRVLNRTLAWFRCLISLKSHILQTDASVRQATWNLLLQNAAAVGFYSTWLTLIRFHDANLAGKFVADSVHQLLYPGTDISSLP